MTITASQRTSIIKTWGKVCKDRGWKQSDRALRLATFGKLIGRTIASADEIDRMDECTKLMKELSAMLGVSVKDAQEADDQSINRARVLRHQILTEIIPCLELYRGEKLVEDLAGIMEDKNRWWKIDRPTRGMTLMDLNARPIYRTNRTTGEKKFMGSQLSQMQWTLSRWMNDLRNIAGDTIHTMKIKAGVECDCADCCRRRSPITVIERHDADCGLCEEVPVDAVSPF